jgi:hypothetical protein
MKEYILKPTMTPATVALTPNPDKPAVVRIIPPRQPLPTAVIDPAKPQLKFGLDVHLEFIMAVAQKDHAIPHEADDPISLFHACGLLHEGYTA